MTKYDHMLDIAFTVISEEEDGSDITPEQIHVAIAKRLVSIAESNEYEIGGAIGICDTYEIEEEDDEVRILMNVHCLLCLATFPENSTASTVDTCPNCGNADKKQIIHLQENDNGR